MFKLPNRVILKLFFLVIIKLFKAPPLPLLLTLRALLVAYIIDCAVKHDGKGEGGGSNLLYARKSLILRLVNAAIARH